MPITSLSLKSFSLPDKQRTAKSLTLAQGTGNQVAQQVISGTRCPRVMSEGKICANDNFFILYITVAFSFLHKFSCVCACVYLCLFLYVCLCISVWERVRVRTCRSVSMCTWRQEQYRRFVIYLFKKHCFPVLIPTNTPQDKTISSAENIAYSNQEHFHALRYYTTKMC